MNQNKINVEAEGSELILRNKAGDHVIIPKKYRREVQDMIAEGCHNCLDDLISTLPTMDDYAEDGSVIPLYNKDGRADLSRPLNKQPLQPIGDDIYADPDTGMIWNMDIENSLQRQANNDYQDWVNYLGQSGERPDGFYDRYPTEDDWNKYLIDYHKITPKDMRNQSMDTQQFANGGDLTKDGLENSDNYVKNNVFNRAFRRDDILEKQIMDENKSLYNIGKVKDFKILEAEGLNKEHLEQTNRNPEYFSKGDTWYPYLDDESQPIKLPNKNKYRTLVDDDDLTTEQLKNIVGLDFTSHALHNDEEYNRYSNELNKQLISKYGQKFIDNNGGTDAYVRGLLSDSEEYAPYKKELAFLDPNFTESFKNYIKTGKKKLAYGGEISKDGMQTPIGDDVRFNPDTGELVNFDIQDAQQREAIARRQAVMDFYRNVGETPKSFKQRYGSYQKWKDQNVPITPFKNTKQMAYGGEITAEDGMIVPAKDGKPLPQISKDKLNPYDQGVVTEEDRLDPISYYDDGVPIEAELPWYAKQRDQYKQQFNKEWYFDNMLPKFSKNIGLDREGKNWSKETNADYDSFIMDKVADDLLSRDSDFEKKFREDRISALNSFTPKELEVIKASRYGKNIDPSVWDMAAQGVSNTVNKLLAPNSRNEYRNSGLTKEEAKSAGLGDAVAAPFHVAAKVPQALMNKLGMTPADQHGDFTFGDALRFNNAAPAQLDMATDASNLLGIGLGKGLLKGAGKLSKFGKVAENSDELIDLWRIQERGAKPMSELAAEGKLGQHFNNEQAIKHFKDREKYFGQWFTKDKADLDWYIKDREFTDPEIIQLRVPKNKLTEFQNYDKSLSRAPEREFVVPTELQNNFKLDELSDFENAKDTFKMSKEDYLNMSNDEKLAFIETVDKTITERGKKFIEDLKSPEGKKRLLNQFKEADPTLNNGRLAEGRLEELYQNRLKAIENSIEGNRARWLKDEIKYRSSEYFSEQVKNNFLKDLNMDHYFPYGNAHYGHESLYSKPKQLENTYKNFIDLQKIDKKLGNAFLENDPSGGYITLGKGYEDDLVTAGHETGHAVQKGGTMPIDKELNGIIDSYMLNKGNKVKGFVDDIWRNYFSGSGNKDKLNSQLHYLLNGSITNKRITEGYPYMVETRDLMKEKNILKNTYEPITLSNLTKAKFKESELNTNNRLLYIIPPWDRGKLAKVMNKAPLVVPPAIGASYLYNQSKQGSQPESQQE